MRASYDRRVESGRILSGEYASNPGEPWGCFKLRCPLTSTWLNIVVGNGDPEDWEANNLPLPRWEHVSASTVQRVPTWEELCWVKDLFWLPEECVIQFHPPRDRYINCHPNTLHLWRPIGVDLPMPPLECI